MQPKEAERIMNNKVRRLSKSPNEENTFYAAKGKQKHFLSP